MHRNIPKYREDAVVGGGYVTVSNMKQEASAPALNPY